MKKLRVILLMTVSFLLFYSIVCAQEKLGLLLIAHGSPMPQWNAPVLKIEKEVQTILSQKGCNQFSAVRVALMEFNEPSINTVIKDFEKRGIDKVYAIPLFIAPSGHSLFDIPAILGLYSDKDILNEIKSEGTEIVDTKVKITIGPTLNHGDILKNSMLDRVKALSTTPDSEGVVLLAHGDERFEPIWDSICKEIGYYVCAKTGIDYFDYAFVEVGQSFAAEGVPTILKAAEKKGKIIVVGLYLSMGVEKMANSSASLRMGKKTETKKLFADKNIRFAKRGILPDKRISEWAVDRAIEWAEGLQ
ncbi:sirohydrochlorin cobaltochelatase [bacterium BMS3Bbin03]|nr:sirohydrochlorin cobaltochelatase [bacterium BMS3Bbin03]